MEEYRLDIRIKNNIICSKIERLGYKNISAFCEDKGLKDTDVGHYINMKVSPLKYSGGFKNSVISLANALCCAPDELFSQEQLYAALESNRHIKKISEAEAKYAFENQPDQKLLLETVNVLQLKNELSIVTNEALSKKEQLILNMRYGLNNFEPETYRAIGKKLSLSGERIRAIETSALKKLKDPKYLKNLIEKFSD